VPGRGEVWLVDLGMVHKARPALVLNRAFKESDRALISVIPHTTSLRGSDLEVSIKCPLPQARRVPGAKSRDRADRQGGTVPG
jgi:mRNA-degrading endonuclease toxin of MazEF toxin-antitoxin module